MVMRLSQPRLSAVVCLDFWSSLMSNNLSVECILVYLSVPIASLCQTCCDCPLWHETPALHGHQKVSCISCLYILVLAVPSSWGTFPVSPFHLCLFRSYPSVAVSIPLQATKDLTGIIMLLIRNLQRHWGEWRQELQPGSAGMTPRTPPQSWPTKGSCCGFHIQSGGVLGDHHLKAGFQDTQLMLQRKGRKPLPLLPLQNQ